MGTTKIIVKTLSVVFTLLPAGHVLAQCGSMLPGAEVAGGYVYHDSNNNQQRDGEDAGIANVSVSNGCDVVLTDNSGRYQINLAPGQILFISQPAGYRVQLDEHNIPQFFYRHYPQGTPQQIDDRAVDWSWPVTEATGALPESVDFPLMQYTPSAEFAAHAFADTQARSDLDQDKLREDLINPLIGNPYGVEFGITVGDVVYDNLALYERHKDMMALMDIPQWYLPGNHDINFESPDAHFANETYKRHFGPTYYSFNVGNVHFVSLNNVQYAGAGQRLAEGGVYRGYISEDQLHWLAQDLALVPKDKLIVIATHIPLVSSAQDSSGSEPATGPATVNFDALLELLAPFDHIYGMAGHDTSNSWKVEVNHTHNWQGQPWIAHTLAEVRGNGWGTGPQDARGVNDAMMQDGNPNGFYVLRFDDVNVVPEFIPFPFGPDAGRRLRITLDPPLLSGAQVSQTQASGMPASINRGSMQAATNVVVNLFDGGVRDNVWMSLNGGERQAMIYTVRTDPFAEHVHAQHAETGEATGEPQRSSHIWQLALPALPAGIHRVEVFSEDEFGQHQHGVLSFEISQ